MTGLDRMLQLLKDVKIDDRTSIITDWRSHDKDLPDVRPGGEHEFVIASQKFVVLRLILVIDMVLVRLQIGEVDVAFELENAEGWLALRRRTYRLKDLGDGDIQKRLRATGAAVAPSNTIAIVPGLEVRVLLRNESAVSVKPRAALLVQEENPC